MNSAYQLGYDQYGIPNLVTTTIGASSYSFSGTSTPLSTPSTIVYPDANNSTAVYNYNDLGQLDNISLLTDGQSSGTVYAQYADYNLLDEPTTITYGTTTQTNNYSSNGLLLREMIQNDSGIALLANAYASDHLGQIREVVDCRSTSQKTNALCVDFPVSTASQSADNSRNFSYEYQRLTSAQAANIYGTINYGYDSEGGGNLVSKNNVTYTYKTNTHQVVSSSEGMTAQYNQGNLASKTTSQGTWSFNFNASDWLTSVKLNNQELESYAYDYSGRRVQKVTYNEQGTTPFMTVNYFSRLLETTNYADSSQQTYYLMDANGRFLSFTSGTASGKTPPGVPVPSSKSYLFPEPITLNTQLVTDAQTGEVVSQLFYTPYGGLAKIEPESSDHFRPKYNAHERDLATGLDYFNARYFDPESGRFITADSQMAASMYRQDSNNRYALNLNAPTLYSDPTGHAPSPWCGRLGVATGIGVGGGLTVAMRYGIDEGKAHWDANNPDTRTVEDKNTGEIVTVPTSDDSTSAFNAALNVSSFVIGPAAGALSGFGFNKACSRFAKEDSQLDRIEAQLDQLRGVLDGGIDDLGAGIDDLGAGIEAGMQSMHNELHNLSDQANDVSGQLESVHEAMPST